LGGLIGREQWMTAAGWKTSRPLQAMLWGLVGTAIVAAIHLSGLSSFAESHGMDLCFRNASRMQAPQQIVHVDIDDGSLEALGRWPWPRAQVAGILRTLDECGAKRIAMDLIFPEPQAVRYVSAADEVYAADIDAQLLAKAPPIPVFDDALLAIAIAETNTLVAMHVDTDNEAQTPPDEARHLRARRAVDRHALPAEQAIDSAAVRGTIVPPLVTLAEAASLIGFVNFKPDGDGAVRRIGLLADGDGSIYPQFMLALVAAELTGLEQPIHTIRGEPGAVIIDASAGPVRIPVDEQGYMLVNWVSPANDTTVHISAAAVGWVWRQRQRAEDNGRRMRLIQTQLAVELNQEPLLKLLAQADEAFSRRIAAQRAEYLAMLKGVAADRAGLERRLAEEAAIEARIDQLAAELRGELDEFYLATVPEQAQAREAYDRLVGLRDMWDQLAAANVKIRRDIDTQMDRIRDRVEGKICLIGSSATGAADFVPTPLGPRTPGVVVDGQIINTILSGKFVQQASATMSLVAVIAAGVIVSMIAATRPLLQATVATAVLAAGYVLGDAYLLFARLGYVLPLAAPVGAMVAGLLLVAVYRQLTEERAKRQIKSMFAHALSPTLVDRLLADPSLAELGGQQRSLTCMFSDLAGFTSLSQRLGPQQTVRVLNRYFDQMTDVIQNCQGGFLNKFLGDGIFCFFGAPVTQEDHAARAVEAAVACHQRVAELNETLSADMGEEVALAVRIGVAGGEAMVGNCGSSERMDYTAIGHCVNLASRLESANKDMQTRILIDEASWRRASLERPTRLVGRVRIVGVVDPVVVRQVFSEQVNSETAAAIRTFEEGVELFNDQQFQRAREMFEAVDEALPGDWMSALYMLLCDYGKIWSPGSTWLPVCDEGDVARIAEPGEITLS
jgi:CHASE2 domain-containing sensor protein/class 3 adenylate cyclase